MQKIKEVCIMYFGEFETRVYVLFLFLFFKSVMKYMCCGFLLVFFFFDEIKAIDDSKITEF